MKASERFMTEIDLAFARRESALHAFHVAARAEDESFRFERWAESALARGFAIDGFDQEDALRSVFDARRETTREERERVRAFGFVFGHEREHRSATRDPREERARVKDDVRSARSLWSGADPRRPRRFSTRIALLGESRRPRVFGRRGPRKERAVRVGGIGRGEPTRGLARGFGQTRSLHAQTIRGFGRRELRAARAVDEVTTPHTTGFFEMLEHVVDRRKTALDGFRVRALANEDAVAIEERLGERGAMLGVRRGFLPARGAERKTSRRAGRRAHRHAHHRTSAR